MYAELRCRSHFSFLRGVSAPEVLIEQAHLLGYSALALTDQDGIHGMVRAHEMAEQKGIQLIVGSHISVRRAGEPLVLLAMNHRGYQNLCALITQGRRACPKGESLVSVEQVARFSEGLLALYVGPPDRRALESWAEIFKGRIYVGVTRHWVPGEEERNQGLVTHATELGLPVVAVGDVHAAMRTQKPLLDVVMCIREGMTLDEAGDRLVANSERCLRTERELSQVFHDRPEWLEETSRVAERCHFSLDELKYEFPIRVVPEGETPMSFLRKQVEKGARGRYGGAVPQSVQGQLEHELELIETLNFPGYFLTVWDIVQFARSRGILCQGRGSAANSAVCYVLGITSIDPVRLNLLFERFISLERGEPPDIDVDFEHERREEVLQYVYERYGRTHAAMVCEVITYRTRSALREVGKVLGLSLEEVNRLSRASGGGRGGELDESVFADAKISVAPEVLHWVIDLAGQLKGAPRHLGIHSGGFVITHKAITELVPVENATMPGRTVVQWDKCDLETLGILKIDLLSLGMLTCIRKCFDLVEGIQGERLSLATLPPEDAAVYDEISAGDTIGVFQIESRAQMSMLPRLRPRSFYDLVVEIALIRPGPIQGDMVHPYLRRRQGLEEVCFPHPSVERILGKTYGVPLFQEQVMRLAIAAGGFTPGEADQLRRAMGAWRKRGQMEVLSQRLIQGLIHNGIDPDYAQRVFEQIQGFGEYGFPESHAASFAVLVYASGYLRRHHRAAFTAALLNSQPMGFYSAATIAQDARRHGVGILPIDIQRSQWDCTLERPSNTDPDRDIPPPFSLRLGLRQIRGLRQDVAQRIVAVRRERSFKGVVDLMLRARLPRSTLLRLGSAGAFRSLGLGRRESIWAIQALPAVASPLLAPAMTLEDPWEGLPPLSEAEEVMEEYATTGLSVESHPIGLIRSWLQSRRVPTATELKKMPTGVRLQVVGMVITRQRPGTASGVLFLTLEDETGHVNVVVWAKVAERYRRVIRDEVMLSITGKLDRQGAVCHLIAERIEPLGTLQAPPGTRPRSFR